MQPQPWGGAVKEFDASGLERLLNGRKRGLVSGYAAGSLERSKLYVLDVARARASPTSRLGRS
jgi:hypothetical protein